jgi:hypothetical protein
MPGKQLPNSLAANRPKRANAGKNKKYDEEEPEYCCDSADGSERRQVWIDKNDGDTKKCPYSGMTVDECMATRGFIAWAKDNTVLGDKWKESKAKEQEEDTQSDTESEPEEDSLSDDLKQKLGIRYAECPSTPEATQPQCPGAPGGTFDHSPIPPDFSPTEVEFPDEDKDDVARLVSTEKTPEKQREEEEVYVFPDTESESEEEEIRLTNQTTEIKKEIKKLKRSLEEATKRIEVLIETNSQLVGTVLHNRNAINEQRKEILQLKRQRKDKNEARPLQDIEVVDLTLE